MGGESMTATAFAGTRAATDSEGQATGDVLVVFGITGDLAKVMTFRSLYRLEARKMLDCPIVGVAVDDWTDDDLRQRARASIEGTGEQVDSAVFDRLVERMSYVAGDFGDPSTYERVGSAIAGAQLPVFYLEIPPFLFGRVVKGLADAGLTENARIVVEKPFGHDRESASALAASCTSRSTRASSTASTTTWERWGWRRSSTCGSRTRCSSRSGAAITSTRSRSRWPSRSASRTGVIST